MTARILNGIAIRDQIYAELKQEILALGAAGIRPGLAAVLVGENAASQLRCAAKSRRASNWDSEAGFIGLSGGRDDRRNARTDFRRN